MKDFRFFSDKRDSGNVTVLMIAACLVLFVATLLISMIAKYAILSRQLDNAADASALAGAYELLKNSGNPCETATKMAQQNGVELSSCLVSGSTIQVKVSKKTVNLGFIDDLYPSFIVMTGEAKAGY